MKHFFKSVAVGVVVLIVLLVIHVFCNTHDIHLDSTVTSIVSSMCSLLLYQGLIRIEKNKEP